MCGCSHAGCDVLLLLLERRCHLCLSARLDDDTLVLFEPLEHGRPSIAPALAPLLGGATQCGHRGEEDEHSLRHKSVGGGGVASSRLISAHLGKTRRRRTLISADLDSSRLLSARLRERETSPSQGRAMPTVWPIVRAPRYVDERVAQLGLVLRRLAVREL